MLARDYPECSVTLLGGFEPVDEIPIVRVCNSDNYDSCHEKVWSALERNTGEEADWFIIADDDTWFNLPNLAEILEALPQQEAVICGCVSLTKTADHSEIPHAHGGCGIIISPAAMRAMRGVPRPWPRDGRHSDVSLAMLARTAGIRWCHIADTIGPYDSFDASDLRGVVSVHVKDRASFLQLYAPLTEGQ